MLILNRIAAVKAATILTNISLDCVQCRFTLYEMIQCVSGFLSALGRCI